MRFHVEDVVRRTSAATPGDAAAMVAALRPVYERWAEDWVTSEMGGGGGTGVFHEGDAILLWYQSPGEDWDVKLTWRENRWIVTEDRLASLHGEPVEAHNRTELPLVDAFMAGLHFSGPNRHRWPEEPG